MPVPDTTPIGPEQRKAAAALLRRTAAPAAELGHIFARNGYELALVGGPVRDAFLGRAHSDLDLATDATPPQVLAIARDWADKVWETGIEFGTVGLRKGDVILEITTYRSETYVPNSIRSPRPCPPRAMARTCGIVPRVRVRAAEERVRTGPPTRASSYPFRQSVAHRGAAVLRSRQLCCSPR